jgi:hypothetical protein
MEPAGLALGSIGLAGLFSTCLDVIDRVDTWRNFAVESQALRTRLETEKLRLEKWGEAVGFKNGQLSHSHSEAFDDPRILSRVHEQLLAIRNVCQDSKNRCDLAPRTEGTRIVAGLQGWLNPGSKMHKLKWTLRNKLRSTAQVETLEVLLQGLYNLVPPGPTYQKGASLGPQDKAMNDATGTCSSCMSGGR